MAFRQYIPIDRSLDGTEKEKRDLLNRLLKQQYRYSIGEYGKITGIVDKNKNPKEKEELEVKLYVQQFSFNKTKKIGLEPNSKDDFTESNVYQDETTYIIGVRREKNIKNTYNIGDIIEIEIVNNEMTKRNGIDGFYKSTVDKNEKNLWNFISEVATAAKDAFNGKKNKLSDKSSPAKKADKEIFQITEDIMKTKKAVATYSRGTRKDDIEVVSIEGHLVELGAAEKYLEMKRDAAQQQISLRLNSGFRTMEQQINIFNRRANIPYIEGQSRQEWKSKGGGIKRGLKPAAYPGHSNHQSGTALDIQVGTEYYDRPTKTLNWLMANASKYGFFPEAGIGPEQRDRKKQEPHHWIYKGA